MTHKGNIQANNGYTIQSGDTLEGIAQRAYNSGSQPYQMAIYKMNQRAIGGDSSVLPLGETIWIPSIGHPPLKDTVYIVQPGDTLSSIAQQTYNSGLELYRTAICRINNLATCVDPNAIHPGEPLYLPPISNPFPRQNTFYIVQEGDTLSSIAQQAYNNRKETKLISQSALSEKVIGNRIKPGQILFIELAPDTPPGGGSIHIPTTLTEGDGLNELESDHRSTKAIADEANAQDNILSTGFASEPLQFRAYHPKVVVVEKWHTLLVYAHTPSALDAVRADAAKFKEEMGIIPGEILAQSMQSLPRGTEITVVPASQGVVFNPEQQSFIWAEDWHQTRFRFWADRKLFGSASNGEIVIYAGPLIVATLNISFLFVSKEQDLSSLKKEDINEEAGYLYKQIFASYSHNDTPIVLACREIYKALGFNTLIDIDTLRAGQSWNEELMRMIEEADIFQLFWSAYSVKSNYVRREWKYALKHSKSDGFIRPVYWEKPLVSPPHELEKLHFAYIRPPLSRDN